MKDKIYVCQFCGAKSSKPFVNGLGNEITWCQDCGESMCNALQM